jgi:hypothetical protein
MIVFPEGNRLIHFFEVSQKKLLTYLRRVYIKINSVGAR